VVGVNIHVEKETHNHSIHEVSSTSQKAQIEAVKALRKKRNQKEVDAKLKGLEKAANSSDNLMPHILDSVKAYATVGEISDCLRKVFGVYKPKF
jgi:methylmalonyl-CoA mutase, N-terminal domain